MKKTSAGQGPATETNKKLAAARQAKAVVQDVLVPELPLAQPADTQADALNEHLPVAAMREAVLPEVAVSATQVLVADASGSADVAGRILLAQATPAPAAAAAAPAAETATVVTGTSSTTLLAVGLGGLLLAGAAGGGGDKPINVAPVLTGGSNSGGAQPAGNSSVLVSEDGAVVTGKVTATDGNNDPLKFQLQGAAPEGLVFNADGTYSFDAARSAYQSLGANAATTLTVGFTVFDGTVSTAGQLVFTITGTNDAPQVAAETRVAAAEAGAVVTGQLVATDVDAGDKLSFAAAAGQNPVPGLTLQADGHYSFDPTHSAYADLKAGEVRSVHYAYTVADGHGGSVDGVLTINVAGVNTAPAALPGAAAALEAGAVVNGTVVGTDAEGAHLTYSAANLPAGLTFNADGSYSFDPAVSAYNGLAAGATRVLTVGYTVTDGALTSTANLVITVTGTNDAPVAQAVVATGLEDAASIAITPVSADVDGSDTAAYSVDTLPAHGKVVFNAVTGNFDYTPNANYNGTDSFTYKVTDASGATSVATASVTVTAVADAPVAVAAVGAAFEGAAALTGTVVATDVDSTALTFSLNGAAPAGLTFNADGSYSFDAAKDEYNSLAAGQKLTITVPYTVTDGALTSTADLVITVTGTNDGPVAADVIASGLEDAASIAIAPVSSDVDHGDTAAYSVNTKPAHGSVVFNADTGHFDYTPNANYNGTDSFTYKVTDASGATSVATATVTVGAVNDTPVPSNEHRDATEGGAVVSGQLTASDVEGSALTFALVNPAPAGLTFSPDGSYVFDPKDYAYTGLAKGEVETVTIAYTVSDGDKTATANLVIDVTGTHDDILLTTGLDDKHGGQDDDRFIANTATFNANDQIDGAEGHDTLRLTLGTGDVLPSVVVHSVEQVDIQTGLELSMASADPLFNVVSMSGFDGSVKQINIHDAKSGLVVLDQQSLADITITDSSAVGMGVALTYDQQVVAGSNDTLNLSVNEFNGDKPEQGGFGEANLQIGAGIEGLSLTVSDAPGAETAMGLTAEDLNQITVQGGIAGQGMFLYMDTPNQDEEALVTLDATAFKGDLTLDGIDGGTPGQAAELSTVLLGAGNDSVTVVSGRLVAGNLYALGEGNNSLSLETDQGHLFGAVTAGSGNDSVHLQGDLREGGSISLGDGNNSVSVNEIQSATITTGNGDDAVTVRHSIMLAGMGSAVTQINLGSGNNSLTAENVSGAEITTSTGDDTLSLSSLRVSILNAGGGHDSLDVRVGSVERSTVNFGVGVNALKVNVNLVDSELHFGQGENTADIRSAVEGSDVIFADGSVNSLNASYGVFRRSDIHFGDDSKNSFTAGRVWGSDIHLGHGGSNTVSIDQDVNGANITSAAVEDGSTAVTHNTLTVHRDVGGGSTIDLSDGDTVATIGGDVFDASQVIFGNAGDTLTLGDGFGSDDKVTGSSQIYGDIALTLVDMSDGDDSVTVLAGNKAVLAVNPPLDAIVLSGGSLQGGAGDDTLTVKAVDDMTLVRRDKAQDVHIHFSGDGDGVARFAVGQTVELKIGDITATYKVLASDIVQGSGTETGTNVATGLLGALNVELGKLNTLPDWTVGLALNELKFKGAVGQDDLPVTCEVAGLTDSDPNPLFVQVLQVAHAHIGGFETLELVALNAVSDGPAPNDNDAQTAHIHADFALIDDVKAIHLHSEVTSANEGEPVTFTLTNLHGGETFEVSGHEITTFAATAIQTVNISSATDSYEIGDHIRLTVMVNDKAQTLVYDVVEADLAGASGAADAALIAGHLADAAKAVPELAGVKISATGSQVSVEAPQDAYLSVDVHATRDGVAITTDFASYNSDADTINFSRDHANYMVGDVVSVKFDGNDKPYLYTITKEDLAPVAGRDNTYGIADGVAKAMVGEPAVAVHGVVTGVTTAATVELRRPIEVELQAGALPTVNVPTKQFSTSFELTPGKLHAGDIVQVHFTDNGQSINASYELTAADVSGTLNDTVDHLAQGLNSSFNSGAAVRFAYTEFGVNTSTLTLLGSGGPFVILHGQLEIIDDGDPITTVTNTRDGVMHDDGITDVVIDAHLAQGATIKTMTLKIDGEGDFDIALQTSAQVGGSNQLPVYDTLVADVADIHSHTVNLNGQHGQFGEAVTVTGGTAGESLVLENVDTKKVDAAIVADVTLEAKASTLDEVHLGTGHNALVLNWGSDADLADLNDLSQPTGFTLDGNLQDLVLQNDAMLGVGKDVLISLGGTATSLEHVRFTDLQLSSDATLPDQPISTVLTLEHTNATLDIWSQEDFGTASSDGSFPGPDPHNSGPADQTVELVLTGTTALSLNANRDLNVDLHATGLVKLDVSSGGHAMLALDAAGMDTLESVRLMGGTADLDMAGQHTTKPATVEVTSWWSGADMAVSDSELGDVTIHSEGGGQQPGHANLHVNDGDNAGVTLGKVVIGSVGEAAFTLADNLVAGRGNTATFMVGDVAVDAQTTAAFQLVDNTASDGASMVFTVGTIDMEAVHNAVFVGIDGNDTFGKGSSIQATLGAVTLFSGSDDVTFSVSGNSEDAGTTIAVTTGAVDIDSLHDGSVAVMGNVGASVTLGTVNMYVEGSDAHAHLGFNDNSDASITLGDVTVLATGGSDAVTGVDFSISQNDSATFTVGTLDLTAAGSDASVQVAFVGNSDASVTIGDVTVHAHGEVHIGVMSDDGSTYTLGNLAVTGTGSGDSVTIGFADNTDTTATVGDVTANAAGPILFGLSDGATSDYTLGELHLTATGSDGTVGMGFLGNSDDTFTAGEVTVHAGGAMAFHMASDDGATYTFSDATFTGEGSDAPFVMGFDSDDGTTFTMVDVTATAHGAVDFHINHDTGGSSYTFSDASFTATGSDGLAMVSLDFLGNSDATVSMGDVTVHAHGEISLSMVGDHSKSEYTFGDLTLTGQGSDAPVSISFLSDAATTFTMGDVTATAQGDISISVVKDTLKSKYTFGDLDLTAEGSGANVMLDFQSDNDATFTFGDLTATGTSDSGLTISDDSASTYTFSDATITANGVDADVRVLIDGSNNSTITMGAVKLDADSDASFDFTGGTGSKLNLKLTSLQLLADGDASLSVTHTVVAANGGSLLGFGNVTMHADHGSDDSASITIGGAGSDGVDGIGINLGYAGTTTGTVVMTGHETSLSIINTTNAKVHVGDLTMSSNDKASDGFASIEMSDDVGVFSFGHVHLTTSDGEAMVDIHDNGELGKTTTITVADLHLNADGWTSELNIHDNVGSASGSRKTTVTIGDVELINTSSDGLTELYISDNSDTAVTLGGVTMDAADHFGGTRAVLSGMVDADLLASDGDYNLSVARYGVSEADGYDSFFEIEGNTGVVTVAKAGEVALRGVANTLAIHGNDDVTLGNVKLVGLGSTVAVFENMSDSTVTLGDVHASGIVTAVYLDAENSSDSSTTNTFDLAFGSDDMPWSDGQNLEDLSGLGKTGYDDLAYFDSGATPPKLAIWDSANPTAGTLDAFGSDADSSDDGSYTLTVGDIDVDGLRVVVALDHVEGAKHITVHGSKEAALDSAFTVASPTADSAPAGKSVVLLEHTPDVQTLTITGSSTVVVLSGDLGSFHTLDLTGVGATKDDGISYVYDYKADFGGGSKLTTDDAIVVNLGSGNLVYNALDKTATDLTDASFETAGATTISTQEPGHGNNVNEFFHFGGADGSLKVGTVVLGGFTLTADPGNTLKSADGHFKDVLDFTDFDWNGDAAGKGSGLNQLQWKVDTNSGDVAISFTNPDLKGSILLVGAALNIAPADVDDWISHGITGATGHAKP